MQKNFTNAFQADNIKSHLGGSMTRRYLSGIDWNGFNGYG